MADHHKKASKSSNNSNNNAGKLPYIIFATTLLVSMVFLVGFLWGGRVGDALLMDVDVLSIPPAYKLTEECIVPTSANSFYVDPITVQNERIRLFHRMLEAEDDIIHQGEETFYQVIDEFFDTVGANGVFDVWGVLAERKYLGEAHTKFDHTLGEYFASKCETLEDYKDMVGIVACKLRNSGTLHGVVWTAMMVIGFEDEERLYSSIRYMCDYKDQANLSMMYNGCAHGAGHGFLMAANHNDSMAYIYCNKFKDRNFAYQCASGIVHSDLQHPHPMSKNSSENVCGRLPLSGMCYIRDENRDMFKHNHQICDTVKHKQDNYLGCAYGLGMYSAGRSCKKQFKEEPEARIACYSGAMVHLVGTKRLCNEPKEDDLYSICKGTLDFQDNYKNAYILDPEQTTLVQYNWTVLDRYVTTNGYDCCLY